MKIISWNVKRADRKGFYSEVMYLNSKYDTASLLLRKLELTQTWLVRLLKESIFQNLLKFSCRFLKRDLVTLEKFYRI